MPSEFPDQLSVGKNVVLGTVPLGPVRQCQQDAPRPTNCVPSVDAPTYAKPCKPAASFNIRIPNGSQAIRSNKTSHFFSPVVNEYLKIHKFFAKR